MLEQLGYPLDNDDRRIGPLPTDFKTEENTTTRRDFIKTAVAATVGTTTLGQVGEVKANTASSGPKHQGGIHAEANSRFSDWLSDRGHKTASTNPRLFAS
jgi:hypothetical protein